MGQVMIDDETALLDILDTAGQEEVSVLYDKILRTKDTDKVPIGLVGNKCDLKDERDVEYIEGADLAKQWGCSLFETSAKIKLNNEACFFELVREIRKTKQQVNPSKKGKSGFPCSVL